MAADGNAGQSTEASIEARLEIPGLTGFEVVSLEIREGLSQRTHASVEIASPEDLAFSSVLLEACTLTLERRSPATRTPIGSRVWTLRLGQARYIEHKDATFRFRLDLFDSLWPLGLGMSTRKYRNLTAREIISKLLDEGQVAHDWALTEELPKRKYTAQYRESNLTFIERLLEFEGIYYSFDESGAVLLRDTSQAAELLRGGQPYPLLEAATGMARGEVGLHVARKGRRITTGRVVLGDYNWKTPDQSLRTAAEGEYDNDLERYVFPAGYRNNAQGERLATKRIEAYRAEAVYLEGKGNDPHFAAGMGFAVDGEAVALFSGEYLLVRVEHAARNGAFQDGKDSEERSRYENRFTAIPKERPFRPVPRTPRPTVDGIHTAMVRGPAGEEIHTDRYGRFRAQLHWDREAQGNDEDSRWVRLLQETSSSMTLARTGWEVMLGYIDGDPDRPVGLGRAINGQMTPTYGQPANSTMMAVHTPSSPATGGFSEIKMDDAAGSQHISVQAERDLSGLIKNDKSETVGLNETHTTTADFKRLIQGNQKVTIGANDSATYDDTSELKVKGNRSLKVGASESIKIGGGQHQTVSKSDSEKVGATRINLVGSIKIPDFKALAKSALAQINPLAAIQGVLKDPMSALLPIKDAVLGDLKKQGQSILKDAQAAAEKAFKEKGLGGALDAGLNSAMSGLNKTLPGLPGSIQSTLQSSLTSTVQGLLPGVNNLKDLYSLSALQQGLTSKLDGAISTATGGLYDSFFPKGQNGRREFTIGWDQVDKLIDTFTIGGISKTAVTSIKVLVGGATVKASLGPMSWGSKLAWMETVGGVKYTRTPITIDQDVTGKMKVTVLGLVKRGAGKDIVQRSDGTSKIDVGATTTWDAAEAIEISGKTKVEIDAGSELVIQGDSASFTMKPGSLVMKGSKMGITANGGLKLKGNMLKLSKS